MKHQADSLVNAVRDFASQQGWNRSDYRVFVRMLQPDGIYIKVFTDKVEAPRSATTEELLRSIRRIQSQFHVNDPGSQAVVSLRSLAEANDQPLLSFLEFREAS